MSLHIIHFSLYFHTQSLLNNTKCKLIAGAGHSCSMLWLDMSVDSAITVLSFCLPAQALSTNALLVLLYVFPDNSSLLQWKLEWRIKYDEANFTGPFLDKRRMKDAERNYRFKLKSHPVFVAFTPNNKKIQSDSCRETLKQLNCYHVWGDAIKQNI